MAPFVGIVAASPKTPLTARRWNGVKGSEATFFGADEGIFTVSGETAIQASNVDAVIKEVWHEDRDDEG